MMLDYELRTTDARAVDRRKGLRLLLSGLGAPLGAALLYWLMTYFEGEVAIGIAFLAVTAIVSLVLYAPAAIIWGMFLLLRSRRYENERP